MISKYLDEKLITFLDVDDQKEALEKLVDLLDEEERLLDRDVFVQAILNREKIVSTGIGMGFPGMRSMAFRCVSSS